MLFFSANSSSIYDVTVQANRKKPVDGIKALYTELYEVTTICNAYLRIQ